MGERTKADLTLNNLYGFLYSRLHDHIGVIFHKNSHIIETDTACYRLGYSASTNTFFLFYAWHPEELDAQRLDVDAPLEFVHKDRLWTVKIDQSLTEEFKQDGKTVFDVSWLAHEITNVGTKLPRILFGEGMLQQVTPTESASLHVGYSASKHTDDDVLVKIRTRVEGYGLFHASSEGKPTANKTSKLPRIAASMRRAGEKILRRTDPTIYLTAGMMQDGNALTRRTFDAEGLSYVLLADFGERLKLIRYGFDPLALSEQPLLWLYRTGQHVRGGVRHFFESLREEPGKVAREMSDKAMSLMMNGGYEFFKDLILSKMFHLGERDDSEIISKSARPRWRGLINSDLQGSGRVKSKFRQMMRQPDPDKWRDIEATDPKFHDIKSGMWRPERMVDPDAARTFRLWVQRLFKAPPISIARYFDSKGSLVDPRGLTPQEMSDTIKLVLYKQPSGMILYFEPRTQKLYGYYHKPDNTKEYWLPSDICNHLHKDEIWKFNAASPLEPGQPISSVQFKAEIDQVACNIDLHSADAPPKRVPGPFVRITPRTRPTRFLMRQVIRFVNSRLG
jgi:hypothetical protein